MPEDSEGQSNGEKSPLRAEGLDVIDGSTPWLNPEQMPEKPGGYLYGVRIKNHPRTQGRDYPCGSEEELIHLLAKEGPRVHAVYLPDRDVGVPRLSLNRYHPYEKKDLRAIFFRKLPFRVVLALGMIGWAIYLNSGASFSLFLIGLIFGIVPVFDGFFQWIMYPRNKPVAELKKSMIESSFFFDWIEKSRRSKYLIWLSLVIFAVVFYGQKIDGDVGFTVSLDVGAIQGERIREDGEWWRMFTGTLMHGALWHLALNAMGFFYIGKFIHRLTLPVMVLIVFVISAFAGSLASTLSSASETMSVGASGGVVGMLGFLAWLVLIRRKELPYDFRSFTIRNLLLLTTLGIIGFFFIDNAGHAGGLVGGLGCGLVYHRLHLNRWDVPNTPMKTGLGVACSAVLIFGLLGCVDLFFFGGKYLVPFLPRISW